MSTITSDKPFPNSDSFFDVIFHVRIYGWQKEEVSIPIHFSVPLVFKTRLGAGQDFLLFFAGQVGFEPTASGFGILRSTVELLAYFCG